MGSVPLYFIYFCFCCLKKSCFTANLPIIMQTHSEFSEEPSSVSSEVSSKFIIIDYRSIFKKILESLCPIPKIIYFLWSRRVSHAWTESSIFSISILCTNILGCDNYNNNRVLTTLCDNFKVLGLWKAVNRAAVNFIRLGIKHQNDLLDNPSGGPLG